MFSYGIALYCQMWDLAKTQIRIYRSPFRFLNGLLVRYLISPNYIPRTGVRDCRRMRQYKKNTAADVLRCFWWEQRESNPRPSACKADALNQLSYAPKLICIPTWSLFPNRECKYMTIFPFSKNNLTFLPPELRIYCATPQRTLISCAYFTFSRRNLRTSFHL